MPPLLQSAQLKPDVTITSADSDDDIDESDDERSVLGVLNLKVAHGYSCKRSWVIEVLCLLNRCFSLVITFYSYSFRFF